jgi:gamma-glutamyl-gamma-aminobutyrate hydrolase PuuD
MGNILVIDHLFKGKQSYFIPILRNVLEAEGFQPEVKSYLELRDIDPTQYQAVISASGYCTIRGNKKLADENTLTDLCEEEGIPTLYLCHGAQVKAVHETGDDAIVESDDPRKITHRDYEGIGDAENDKILHEVDIDKLVSKEYHDYDIVKIGDNFKNLLVDRKGNTILARHRDEHKISYMMQMHPEYVGGDVNSKKLLTNFLNMVRLHK